MKVIKRNGNLEEFDKRKIINACKKSADRVLFKLDKQKQQNIVTKVLSKINKNEIEVKELHSIVEKTLLELYPEVGKQYQQYRNYKLDFAKMLDEVYQKSQEIRYIGDVSNANTDSAMVSTQRSLIYGELNKELYKKFFLNQEERQACKEGYIYVHDMKDRLDSFNCLLFDMENVLSNGFEMGNVWYNEPKTLDVAFDVISDVTISASSQSYGGFTIPRVDKLLSKYAEKSFNKYCEEYVDIMEEKRISYSTQEKEDYAYKKTYREMEQGFQSWEYRFNTVGSSRGDYPFIAITFGVETDIFGKMVTEVVLKTRMNGQGKSGYKKPVLFPKLSFLYDEKLHGNGKELESLFDLAIQCSSKTMYPDYISLSGEGYIPSMYKEYNEIVSLMSCRASLSPYYQRGGNYPQDNKDKPYFNGRANLGVISLNLPMILAKARQESRDFYEVLDYYLEMIRNLHKRTYEFLGEKKASTNPLCFMQGGLNGGILNAEDKIKPLLNQMTMTFGITALNELQQLYNAKSLVEDGTFALEIMEYINNYVTKIKKEDEILWAVYGVPAESLCGTQVQQFRKLYGVIENVSDKEYFSNSFHCHVSEDITPIQKQDLENRFWDCFNGGKIQYCKYPTVDNLKAIKTVVRRAMELGFYEGVNLALSYCDDCGHQELNMEVCPKCGSSNLTKIERMNGLTN